MSQTTENLYVQAQVGDERVGFPVSAVREIILVPPITRIPRSPRWLRGAAALRGQTVPIVCLRERFGAEPVAPSPRMRVIIAEINQQPIGFLVDSVFTVRRFAPEEVEPPASVLLNEQNEYVQAIGHDGEHLVLLLNPERLLERKQLEKLNAMDWSAAA